MKVYFIYTLVNFFPPNLRNVRLLVSAGREKVALVYGVLIVKPNGSLACPIEINVNFSSEIIPGTTNKYLL